MIRYSCAIGITGTLTPASLPISPANMPPALTTTSASTEPLSVSTPGDAPLLHADRRHARLRGDLGAAATRALRQGKGELARVDVAVRGEVGGAEHALGRHRREELLSFLGGDELEGEPEGLRPAGLARKLLHAFLGRGEAERADLVPAGLEADLVRQRAVELDRAHHHPGQAQGAAQLPDEPRRVEGGAARQVGALDEEHVLPAEPGEPVENGGAADASSDHDRSRPVPHARQP